MLCPTGCKNIALPARHLEEEATKRKVARAFLPPPPSSECGPYLNSPPNPVRFSPPEELWTPLFALHDPIRGKADKGAGKGLVSFSAELILDFSSSSSPRSISMETARALLPPLPLRGSALPPASRDVFLDPDWDDRLLDLER